MKLEKARRSQEEAKEWKMQIMPKKRTIERIKDMKVKLPSAESYVGMVIYKTGVECECVEVGRNEESGKSFLRWNCTWSSTGELLQRSTGWNPLTLSELPSSYESFINNRKKKKGVVTDE